MFKKMIIIMMFLFTIVWARDYTGFNAWMQIDNLTDLGFYSTGTMNISSVNGVGIITIVVTSNLNKWGLQAESDYVGAYSTQFSHILTASVGVVVNGVSSASVVYKALVVSSDANAAGKLLLTNQAFNYDSPGRYDFYLKFVDLRKAKATYYNANIQLKVLTE